MLYLLEQYTFTFYGGDSNAFDALYIIRIQKISSGKCRGVTFIILTSCFPRLSEVALSKANYWSLVDFWNLALHLKG